MMRELSFVLLCVFVLMAMREIIIKAPTLRPDAYSMVAAADTPDTKAARGSAYLPPWQVPEGFSFLKVRSELSADPYNPPQTLVNFAHSLAKPMDIALGDYRHAVALKEELRHCLSHHEVRQVAVAQRICAYNLRRLELRWA